MMFAKLMNTQGGRIDRPTAVEASISYTAKDGRAFAFAADGKTLIAEMEGARVDWIAAGGVRLVGLEPINMEKTKFRPMEWQWLPDGRNST